MKNALNCAEKALELSQRNNEKWIEAWSWTWLGRIMGKIDPLQTDKARDCIIKGIKICEDSDYRSFSAEGYLYLGELHADTGQREKALENLKKAEGMFQEMGMDYWLGKTQEVLGRL